MFLINCLKAVNPTLTFLFVLSIFSIILIDFFLIEVPEFVGWGAEFGKVWSSLCVSIISSYIFYFVVVHIKEYKDSLNLGLYLSRKCQAVLSSHEQVMRELRSKIEDDSNEKYYDLETLHKAFLAISPHGKAPMVIGPHLNNANWLQFFYNKSQVSKDQIRKVYEQGKRDERFSIRISS
ncbi:hypothetical protein [Marinomonas mediterranea]|uniref:hypothetical protein n=1 Tax=Marinomonas mediterranea TaxID=119864 RepID=UPI00234BD2B2|nr:hypothetical protein [Marinomonas mediterranea]WCN10714.1 hypothetical protein GV055_18175 [Marinomonas mediterranea]